MTEGQSARAIDIALVTGIQTGQSQAESALYQRYAGRVYYLALRESHSPHDAEDVRAETFLRVLQAIRRSSLRTPEALPSFIWGTTRNVLHELFARKKHVGTSSEERGAAASVPPHEELFLDQEVRHAIAQTIDSLKTRDRDLLRLHFYEELPTEEIARRLGIAPERVRLVKSRALKRFGEIYRKHNEAPDVRKS
jgi:RNA polymerase sigma-70 factor (ECF subfamily)